MNQRPRTEIRQTQRLALSLGLAASIKVLRQDASGLTMYLEEQAAENPWLRLDRPVPPSGEWLPRWSSTLAGLRGNGGVVAQAGAAGPSLISHVLAWIERMVPPSQRAAAQVFAEALEPSGWLGRALPDIAAEARMTLPEMEALLRLLQRIDPPGLFARNLAECLELQCREAGLMDAVMAVVLARLDLLAVGDHARLARLASVPEAEIALRQRRIRGLNPKPGAVFDPVVAPVREPDLIVRQGSSGWQVALNRSALPDVWVAPWGKALDENDRAKRQAAQALCRQVEARSATLQRIGAEILRRQEAVIQHGPVALRPMTMAEVAEATELHVSTVSRAVAGASIDLPAGTFWLRHLFSGAMGRSTGGEDAQPTGPAAAALRARLAQLVAAEDARHPLGDAALSQALAEDGVAPSRRTVAKYRAALSIPPAHRRRLRRPALQ